jgi:nitrate reductase NapE component
MWFAAVSLAFGLASLPNGPESAAISLSGLFLRFCDQPIEHVLGEVVGFGLIVWPYWMLTSPRGKATFGLATKR